MNRDLPWLLLIKRINDFTEAKINSALKELDLTFSQGAVILNLKDAPDMRMPLKKLEALLHVAQSTTVRIVANLEKKGFVKRESGDGDRRVKCVRLTKKGKALIDQADSEAKQMEDRLLSVLGRGERECFIDLLKKICASLK